MNAGKLRYFLLNEIVDYNELFVETLFNISTNLGQKK